MLSRETWQRPLPTKWLAWQEAGGVTVGQHQLAALVVTQQVAD